MQQQSDSIRIKAIASRNGLTTLVFSGGCLCIFLLWLKIKDGPVFIAEYFLLLVFGIGVLLGFLKVREPDFSFELTEDSLSHFHKYGRWQIAWENIQRVDIPTIMKGFERQDLSYIGIKLKVVEPFLDKLAPRLAVRMVMEQQALFVQLLKTEAEPDVDHSDHIFNISDFRSASGKIYYGTSAMYAHRMMLFRKLTGFDILLPVSSIDREPRQFVELLRNHMHRV